MTERNARRVSEFLAVHPTATILEIRIALALRPFEVFAALDLLSRGEGLAA